MTAIQCCTQHEIKGKLQSFFRLAINSPVWYRKHSHFYITDGGGGQLWFKFLYGAFLMQTQYGFWLGPLHYDYLLPNAKTSFFPSSPLISTKFMNFNKIPMFCHILQHF